MSGGWHRHGPRLHQGAADLCSAAPDGVPVLVVDLAGAREQIARALGERLAEALGWDWNEEPGVPSVSDVIAGIVADLTPHLLAALGAPEEGRS